MRSRASGLPEAASAVAYNAVSALRHGVVNVQRVVPPVPTYVSSGLLRSRSRTASSIGILGGLPEREFRFGSHALSQPRRQIVGALFEGFDGLLNWLETLAQLVRDGRRPCPLSKLRLQFDYVKLVVTAISQHNTNQLEAIAYGILNGIPCDDEK